MTYHNRYIFPRTASASSSAGVVSVDGMGAADGPPTERPYRANMKQRAGQNDDVADELYSLALKKQKYTARAGPRSPKQKDLDQQTCCKCPEA